MAELLDKLKEGKIMAAIVGRDGKAVASNFTLNEGLEGYVASSFNIGDSFLREVGEEASELVISTDKGNIVIKSMGNEQVLIAQILTKEQYALYKELVAGASRAPKKKAAAKAAVPKKEGEAESPAKEEAGEEKETAGEKPGKEGAPAKEEEAEKKKAAGEKPEKPAKKEEASPAKEEGKQEKKAEE
jgi:predicted regulator of Ras-like GTPase activity (Roadblock/LC7/MglB family)